MTNPLFRFENQLFFIFFPQKTPEMTIFSTFLRTVVNGVFEIEIEIN